MPAEERMDFITIVTPNFAHFAPAKMALENGFNVVIEKPMTFTLDEAKELKKKVDETGLFLPYTYIFRLPNGKGGKAMMKERAWEK